MPVRKTRIGSPAYERMVREKLALLEAKQKKLRDLLRRVELSLENSARVHRRLHKLLAASRVRR